MALVDYEFYVNTYGSSVIMAESFPSCLYKANNMFDRITYGHIVYDSDSDSYGQVAKGEFTAFTKQEITAVQYAVCALADEMYKLEKVKLQAVEGNESVGNIKSRSSGGESISYESKPTVYDEAVKDDRKKLELYRETLLEYMPPEIFRINPFYAGLR